MIRIFSKKAFEFTNPANVNEKYSVKALSFDTVPDYAKEDNLWKWALADGDLEIFEDVKAFVKPEKTK